MYKYDLIILTTALNRSSLHTICLSPIPLLLKELRVKWLINIDRYSEEDTKDTEYNLKNILSKDTIDLEIFHPPNPCVFKAVKRLSHEGYKYLNETKYGVFYLEDDWPLTNKIFKKASQIDLKILLDRYLKSDKDYISLNLRDKLNFNPGIWSKGLFKEKFIERFKKNKYEPRCPETLVCEYWEDKKGNKIEETQYTNIHYPFKTTNNNLKSTSWFKDSKLGKKWVDENLGKVQYKRDGSTVNYHKNYANGTHDPSSNLTYVIK